MIGPRPTRGRGGAASRPPGGAAGGCRSGGGIQASTVRKRSRSRSPPKQKGGTDEKEKKEFAWMDSSDDEKSGASKKSAKSSASSAAAKPVPLKEVQTLGQMARQAPDLERRLKRGDVRPRELVDAAAALARSKFFDAGLFEPLHAELARACRKRLLNTADIVAAICDLAELNAYDNKLFEVACVSVTGDIERQPEADRKRLEAALKRVKHDPGQRFFESLRSARQSGDNGKAACPMFFRGQCKWGPKCKLSHDDAAFERDTKNGSWKPPSQSVGKTGGGGQSSDLFKSDRCGQLW